MRSDVKVQQYFYIKHRIRLLYPQLKCIVEYHNKGHCKYYPLELLAIEESAESEPTEKPAAETDYLDCRCDTRRCTPPVRAWKKP
ncbi:hypothetical protein niasHS_012672 [Heterodera schachtii]|uniref:Uncharacterized protein n=1 Tax=Heterodera schachtii TaxID=97005 RepID=A0ABD2IUH7_HETSC